MRHRLNRSLLPYPICLLLLCLSCQSDPSPDRSTRNAGGRTQIEVPRDERAVEVVRRAIDSAGGQTAWDQLRTVRFHKTTIRHAEDGSIERRPTQIHTYRQHPSPMMRIEWVEAGEKTVLLNDGERAWKFVDGIERTEVSENNGARNSTFGSHYVFNIPWKLLDPGVGLEYEESRTLEDGTVADVVHPVYSPGVGDAGGYHEWFYYFAPDGRLLRNLLEYEPGAFDLTEYLDFRRVGPFTLPMRRAGWETDAAGEKGRQSSEIIYENIELDPELKEGIFDPANERTRRAGEGV